MSNLEIKVERQHFSGLSLALIHLKGIIDTLSRPELDQAVKDLLAEHIYRFIFEASELKVSGPTILDFFIKVGAMIKEKSGRVVVVNPNEETRTAFELTGLEQYISITNDIASALKLFIPNPGTHTN